MSSCLVLPFGMRRATGCAVLVLMLGSQGCAARPAPGRSVLDAGADVGVAPLDAMPDTTSADVAVEMDAFLDATTFDVLEFDAAPVDLATHDLGLRDLGFTDACMAPETPCNLLDDNCNRLIDEGSSGPVACVPGLSNMLTFAGGRYVTVPYSSVFDLGTAPFTLEAWVRIPTSTTVEFPTIMSTRGLDGDGFLFAICASLSSCATHRGAVLFQMEGVNYVFTASTFTATDSNFHHVAVSRSGDRMSFFGDGLLIGTVAVPLLASISSSGNLFLGHDAPSLAAADMTGAMLGLRIWGIGRSEAQIRATFEMGTVADTTGLIASWRFNEGSGQVVGDQLGGNNGMLGATLAVESSDANWSVF